MTTNVCLAIFVWFMIPETKGTSLEEIDVLFGGANHTEKGADLLHVEDAHHAHVCFPTFHRLWPSNTNREQIGVDNVHQEDTIETIEQHPASKEIKM